MQVNVRVQHTLHTTGSHTMLNVEKCVWRTRQWRLFYYESAHEALPINKNKSYGIIVHHIFRFCCAWCVSLAISIWSTSASFYLFWIAFSSNVFNLNNNFVFCFTTAVSVSLGLRSSLGFGAFVRHRYWRRVIVSAGVNTRFRLDGSGREAVGESIGLCAPTSCKWTQADNWKWDDERIFLIFMILCKWCLFFSVDRIRETTGIQMLLCTVLMCWCWINGMRPGASRETKSSHILVHTAQ